ncbi:MAG: putative multidrug resistance ABC transporter ATP-binding/permease protein YheI [candidate division WS2 bacterium]|uniref:Multidrug resistance ABC transporter ATP-binding/permease protein YheI n=1 Tax=Psychracetigena formicireducens TaxID=2986056 RepID=A0A9E2F1H3_PSYF1|nr:putative multidrug resistance ABC transporter ATP-binding/permease protein YheI [Candidatus Psychracetigena formicireducens]MBT9144732.1 putative multidrug resistance ABC transporter ATP-binding/permease protein YheI [Candidatus Psychracetigena formicireducens]
MYAILLKFIKKHFFIYLSGILLLISVGFLQLLIPQILRQATDEFSKMTATVSSISNYALTIVILAIFMIILRYGWRMLIWGTSRKLEKIVREEFYKKLQTLDSNYYNYHKTGDLMALATNDINAVRLAMGEGLLLITDSLFMTVLGIYYLININFSLFLAVFIPLPIIALVVLIFGRLIHHLFKRAQEGFAQLTSIVQESISGIRVIKAYGQEEGELENFKETAGDLVNRNLDLVRIWGVFTPLVQFLSSISLFITLFYGGRLVIVGAITIGDFVAFHAYLGLLTWPMMALGWVANILQRGKASMQRINEVFDQVPGIKDLPDVNKAISSIYGQIEFKDVTYQYPGKEKPTLEKLSFIIKPGETMGIIGRLGSGKSTMLNLIPRLYDPGEGEIFIDGHNIKSIPLRVLRKYVGYVPQETFLFSDTIKENIAFSFPHSSLNSIEEVLKKAQLYDDVMSLPEKLETEIGERGVTLSGGQKQRATIARALHINPKILILDDSFSSLDTQTEEKLIKAIIEYNKNIGCTTLIVSHRVSCLKHADNIIVIDKGKIIQSGTHDILVKRPGLYAHLFELQQLEKEDSSRYEES